MSGPISQLIEAALFERKYMKVRFKVPAKPPPRGKHWSNLWTGYSPKLNRIVHMYSTLEYYNWIWMEANKLIKSFCEQPFWMSAEYNGKLIKSLIDVWVQWVDREEYWEIKSSEDKANLNKNEDMKRQIYTQQQWCKRNKVIHEIKTEIDIGENIQLLTNWSQIIQLLTIYRDLNLKREMVEVMTILVMEESESLNTLTMKAPKYDGQATLAATYKLVNLGLVEFVDNPQPLTPKSMVRDCSNHGEI